MSAPTLCCLWPFIINKNVQIQAMTALNVCCADHGCDGRAFTLLVILKRPLDRQVFIYKRAWCKTK